MAVSVLIVEDDRNIAELLQMYLEKEGYAVTVAADGGQGLAKFRAIKPDLVLLDVMMPVMDGWCGVQGHPCRSPDPHHHAHRQGRHRVQGHGPENRR